MSFVRRIFVVFVLCLMVFGAVSRAQRNTRRNLRENFMNRISLRPMMGRKEICYESVGCFDVPRKNSALIKVPEGPTKLDTKFYLFRREMNFSKPFELDYRGNLTTLYASKFDPNKPVKVVIHGYMSTWKDPGELAGAEALLQIDDYNVVLVDWANGAKGPDYAMAAANTEVVGRQTGLLLQNMITVGASAKNMHLIGFSLGAHIAGCASETLKHKGHLLGRITGLDPASPLFKHQLVRDKSKKLDISDARFVDVVHTDGSPVFTDGFGLLEPIGHVDYFPNGGREQPGCNDRRGSVVVAHNDKTLDRSIACSHIRAWSYYLESILIKAKSVVDPKNEQCKFIAYPCKKGLVDFMLGRCFPLSVMTNTNRSTKQLTNSSILNKPQFRPEYGFFGEDTKGSGPMYLTTRNEPPYCGIQLQVSIKVSQITQPTRGILHLQLEHGNYKTNFNINCELLDIIPSGYTLYGLAAAEMGSMYPNNTKTIIAHLSYQSLAFQSPENNNRTSTETAQLSPTLYLDQVQVSDMFGNGWQYYGIATEVSDRRGDFFETLSVPMKLIT